MGDYGFYLKIVLLGKMMSAFKPAKSWLVVRNFALRRVQIKSKKLHVGGDSLAESCSIVQDSGLTLVSLIPSPSWLSLSLLFPCFLKFDHLISGSQACA